MAKLERIDTHAHFLPEFYRQALVDGGHSKPDGMPAVPPWDEQSHLEFMKASGITKSYLSISSPGVNFGDDVKAKKLARQVKKYAASSPSVIQENWALLQACLFQTWMPLWKK